MLSLTAHRAANGRFFLSALDVLREARWITRERLMLCGWAFAVLSGFLLVWGVGFYTANGLTAANGEPLGPDFINYYAGAKVAALGEAPLAYDNERFLAFEQTVVGPSSQRIYSYPPTMMLLSLPLALLSYVPALILWTLLGVGLAFAVLRPLVGWREAAVAVIGTPAAFLNLVDANTGFFTASLIGGGLMLLNRRPVVAGICFGFLAYKPHLGLLLPVALIADGRWRTVAAAAATVSLLLLASVALFGTGSWAAFIEQMAVNRSLLEMHHLWHWLLTVYVAARELGAPPALSYALQTASAAAALAVIAIVWRRPGPVEVKAAALAVAIFLATPYANGNDAVVLLFAAAWLGHEGMRTGFLAWERIAVVALLLLPLLASTASIFAGVQLAPFVLWLVLALLVRRALGNPAAPRAATA
jgi:hypothetical protein